MKARELLVKFVDRVCNFDDDLFLRFFEYDDMEELIHDMEEALLLIEEFKMENSK